MRDQSSTRKGDFGYGVPFASVRWSYDEKTYPDQISQLLSVKYFS